jgi:hypothetical protein
MIALAGLIAMPGWKGMMERRPPIPSDSIDSLKADVAAVRQGLHHESDRARDRAASAVS